MKLTYVIVAVILLGSVPTHALEQKMTVKQAYEAIPHPQVTFDAAQVVLMPKDEAVYLQQMFHWVDIGVIERVETMNHRDSDRASNYPEIIRAFGKLRVPDKLQKVHQLIEQAIILHSEVAASYSDSKVRSASGLLIQAYGLLMQHYPKENGIIKSSFYQHICALDYI